MSDANDRHHEPEHDHDDVSGGVDAFHKAEAARQRRAIVYAVMTLAVAGAVFLGVFVFQTHVFTPHIDVDKGEQEVLSRTNDPQCRDMIAQVEKLSDRYMRFEPTIDEKLLGDDPQSIQEIRDEIARIQQRLDEIEEYSHKANLRFDESRKELADWFDYVSLELSFVDRLATEQQAKLIGEARSAKEPADAGHEPADAGTDGVAVDEGDAAAKAKLPQKTPMQRKDGALVSIHDAFQKFRVWHSSSLNPCAAADEGETPWTPPPGQAATDHAATDRVGVMQESSPH